MKVAVFPSKAEGSVAAPPSKSEAQRMILLAAQAERESVIEGLDFSEDVLAALYGIKALGAKVRIDGQSAVICGPLEKSEKVRTVDCRESGAVLRFFIPLCSALGGGYFLAGSKRLFERPLDDYEKLASEHGLLFERSCGGLRLEGKLFSGAYAVSGRVSSQFASGLLLALPALEGDSVLSVLPPVNSAPYIDLTLKVLSRAGVTVKREGNGFFIPGGQRFCPLHGAPGGDWTAGAYLAAFGSDGGSVRVTGLDPDSPQGDKRFPVLLEKLKNGAPEIDLSSCPDLAPLLFVFAALHHGGTFTGTGRLRGKESDRVSATLDELSGFGAEARVFPDRVRVFCRPLHAPGKELSAHGDHRVAMALTLVSSVYGGIIDGAEAVNKSFPGFFEKISALGVKVAAL